MLRENIKAPAIKLPSTNNKEYSLKNSIGSFVIIYFYPKNDTPGCTLEQMILINFFLNLAS